METFHTIAEVSATFLGFAGVIVALRFTRTGQQPVSKYTDPFILGILVTSMFAILFAFLPDLLFKGLPQTEFEWRVANGLFGLWHASATIPMFTWRRSITEPATLRMSLISQPVVGLKLLVAGGLFIEFAYQIYLLGLLWLLMVSIFYFFRSIMKMTDGGNSADA